MDLSPKQKLFCEKYVLNGYNATKAYIEAGYSVKKDITAGKNSHKLLKNAEIQSYIRTLELKREENFIITKEMILNELGKMAFGNLDDIVEIKDGSFCLIDDVDPVKRRIVMAGITNVSSAKSFSKDGMAKSFSVANKDKIKALELIAKMIGALDGESDRSDGKASVSRVLDAIRKLGK